MASSLTMPSAFATAYADSARISGRTTDATRSAAEEAFPSPRSPGDGAEPVIRPTEFPADAPASFVQPIFGASRMRRQALAARERDRRAAERLRTGGGDRDDAASLLEIVHAKGRGEARAARGGQ